ncbi:MAG: hypothetical protein HUU20_05845 [Pirellulales bacterium]|nr:hypothetical protein [Pirellulales bacterium]
MTVSWEKGHLQFHQLDFPRRDSQDAEMVFRYLVRNWLQNAARDKLREAVTEAARKQVSDAAEESAAEPGAEQEERPADVGILFALGIESGGLEDLLSGVITTRGYGFTAKAGGYRGRSIVVFRSGVGSVAAGRAAEAMIAGHEPKWIISAGFAGGLADGIQHGDVIMADELIDASGQRLRVDLRVDSESLAKTPGVHVGRLLTVDEVVRLPAEKRSLAAQHHALAVDMESFAVAGVCRERQVKFLAVRIVTDAVDEQLPPDLERLLRQNTRLAKLGAVVGTVWNRPGSVKDMWQLKETALVASDRLAKFLAATIEQLVRVG